MTEPAVQESYEYTTLAEKDSIRLIALNPSGDKVTTIQCSLIQTTLTHAQDEIIDHYTALSYVWGDANDTTRILVNGKSFRVTKSLDTALKHLRDEKTFLYVWADGICINQNDKSEKILQVQQMGKIFECASHTVVFLGPCDEGEDLTLSNTLKISGDEKTAVKGSRELQQLLESSWFYRTWTFQELVLARDPRVQWGQLRLRWKKLVHIAKKTSTQRQVEAGEQRRDVSRVFSLIAGMQSARLKRARAWTHFRRRIQASQVQNGNFKGACWTSWPLSRKS